MADRDVEALQRFTAAVIRFLLARMMDPHLYFEQKYLSTIRGAESASELRAWLEGLVDWMASTGLDRAAIAELDEELGREGLPSFSLMVASGGRTVWPVLARGHISSDEEYAQVISLSDDPDRGTAEDRHLAARLRDRYAANAH
jgi:hypothetical protein